MGNLHLRCRSYVPEIVQVNNSAGWMLVDVPIPRTINPSLVTTAATGQVSTYSSWPEQLQPIAPDSMLPITLEIWCALTIAPGTTGFFPFTEDKQLASSRIIDSDPMNAHVNTLCA